MAAQRRKKAAIENALSQFSKREIVGFRDPDISSPNAITQRAVQEILKGTLNLPTPVQDYLGEKISSAYDRQYGSYVKNGGILNREQYYATADAREAVRNITFDPRMLASGSYKTASGEMRFGDAFPVLNAIRTIGDAENVSVMGVMSGILKGAGLASAGKGADLSEAIGNLTVATMEKMPMYDSGRGSFVNYITKAMVNATTALGRMEHVFRAPTSSIPLGSVPENAGGQLMQFAPGTARPLSNELDVYGIIDNQKFGAYTKSFTPQNSLQIGRSNYFMLGLKDIMSAAMGERPDVNALAAITGAANVLETGGTVPVMIGEFPMVDMYAGEVNGQPAFSRERMPYPNPQSIRVMNLRERFPWLRTGAENIESLKTDLPTSPILDMADRFENYLDRDFKGTGRMINTALYSATGNWDNQYEEDIYNAYDARLDDNLKPISMTTADIRYMHQRLRELGPYQKMDPTKQREAKGIYKMLGELRRIEDNYRSEYIKLPEEAAFDEGVDPFLRNYAGRSDEEERARDPFFADRINEYYNFEAQTLTNDQGFVLKDDLQEERDRKKAEWEGRTYFKHEDLAGENYTSAEQAAIQNRQHTLPARLFEAILSNRTISAREVSTEEELAMSKSVYKGVSEAKVNEKVYRQLYGALAQKDPQLAARTRYVGHGKDQARDAALQERVALFNEAYNTDLSFDPDDPVAYGKQLNGIASKYGSNVARVAEEVLGVPTPDRTLQILRKLQQRGDIPTKPVIDPNPPVPEAPPERTRSTPVAPQRGIRVEQVEGGMLPNAHARTGHRGGLPDPNDPGGIFDEGGRRSRRGGGGGGRRPPTNNGGNNLIPPEEPPSEPSSYNLTPEEEQHLDFIKNFADWQNASIEAFIDQGDSEGYRSAYGGFWDGMPYANRAILSNFYKDAHRLGLVPGDGMYGVRAPDPSQVYNATTGLKPSNMLRTYGRSVNGPMSTRDMINAQLEASERDYSDIEPSQREIDAAFAENRTAPITQPAAVQANATQQPAAANTQQLTRRPTIARRFIDRIRPIFNPFGNSDLGAMALENTPYQEAGHYIAEQVGSYRDVIGRRGQRNYYAHSDRARYEPHQNNLYGTIAYEDQNIVDPATGETKSPGYYVESFVNGENGTRSERVMRIPDRVVHLAEAAAKSAISSTTEGPTPKTRADAAATAFNRLQSAENIFQANWKKAIESDQSLGIAEKQMLGDLGKMVVKEIIGQARSRLEHYFSNTHDFSGDPELGMPSADPEAAARNSKRLYSEAEIDEIEKRSPGFKRRIIETHGSIENALKNKSTTFMANVDGVNMAFEVGSSEEADYSRMGYGDDGGKGPGFNRGGIFSGKLGQAMYGAYIFKRMWSMSAYQSTQAAKEYEQYASDAGLLFSDPDMANTIIGQNARSAVSKNYFGRTASQIYSGFEDAGFGLSGSSDALGRVVHYGLLAGGLASGGAIAAQMFNWQSGTKVGGYAALAVGGVALGMEAFNAIAVGIGQRTGNTDLLNYEYNPVTFGSVVSNATYTSAVTSAMNRYADNLIPGEAEKVRELLSSTSRLSISQRDELLVGYASQIDQFATPTERAIIAKHQMANDYDKNKLIADRLGLMDEIAIRAGEDPKQVMAAISGLMGNVGPDAISREQWLNISESSLSSGLGLNKLLSQAASYADLGSALPGTEGYAARILDFTNKDLSITERAEMMNSAQRYSQYGSQIQSLLPGGRFGWGQTIAEQYNFTQAMTGSMVGMMTSMNNFGMDIGRQDMDMMALVASRQSPYAASVISNIGQGLGQLGVSPMVAYSAAANVGQISPIASTNANAILNWDTQQLSYRTWIDEQNRIDLVNNFILNDGRTVAYNAGAYGVTPNMYRQFDITGQPLAQTNGLAYMGTLNNFYETMASGTSGAQLAPMIMKKLEGIMPFGAGVTPMQQVNAFLGIPQQGASAFQQGLAKAFAEGGMVGMQAFQMKDSAEASLKSAGIQGAQIALTEKYLWGGSAGSWDAPAAGSMWFLEDQMRGLQYQSQIQDFQHQRRVSNLSNQYGIRREAMSEERMNANNAYNLWNMDFNYQSSLITRQNTQIAWQYQDASRQLNYGWQQEDLDEAIRYSSGRERRTLLRQKRRSAVSHNLEEEQIETQREQQEEMWKREDQRFEKQKEYSLELQRMDKESFNLNVEQRETFFRLDQENLSRKMQEYEEQKKIEDEMRQLSRKYQYDQMQLQKASIGLQVEQAKKQIEYAETIKTTNDNLAVTQGLFEALGRNDKAFTVMQAFGTMINGMNSLQTYKLDSLMKFVGSINAVDGYKLSRLIELIFGNE